MYLKGIEIKGFKSFFEKTNINLPKGMISIVGPNGSGKSNILDAIRWVLGEQSVKSLRGEKMEDVIFAGTQTRTQLGACEVTLIIDNEDGMIDIGYSELAIKRKAYRSGESQYFINNKKCRLKDIKELLLDTGIGKEGYSIISQGKVDEIISSNGHQKRTLLEEASGITKYRYKKEEGEKNLASATENLERINDIYKEIESQIQPLKIQKEKAEKYLEYKKELKLQEINKILITNEEYNKELATIYEQKQKLQEEINQNTKILEELTQSITDLENQQAYITGKKEELYNEKRACSEKISKNNMQVSIKEESINSLIKNNELLQEQLTQNDVEMQQIKEKLEQSISEKLEIQNSIAPLQADIKLYQKNENLYKESIQKINLEIRKNEQKSRNIENEISKLETKMEFVKSNIDSFEQKFAEYYEKNQQYKTSLKSITVHIKEKNTIIAQKNNEISVLEAKVLQNKSKFEEYKKENSTIFNAIHEKNYELKDLNTKTKMLENLEQDMQGFSKGIKQILKNNALQGIENIVANVITVEKGYEKAIEQLLSGRLENIIIQKASQTKTAIDYLKKEKLGKATFLPLDVMKPTHLQYNDIGVKAINVVKYDKKYENIISNLLGKMVIVDTMDDALYISQKYNHSFRIATKDGEIFNVGGSITGGSGGYSKDIFTRRSTITQNKENIAKLQIIIENLKQEMQNVAKKEEELQKEHKHDEENLAKCKIEQNMQTNELASLTTKKEHIQNMMNDLAEEKTIVEQSSKEAKQTYNSDMTTISTLQEEFGDIKSILICKNDELYIQNDELEKATSTLKKLEMEYSLVNQKISNIQSQIQDLSDTIGSNSNKTEASKNKIDSNIELIEKHKQAILDLHESNATLENEISAITTRINKIEDGEKNIKDEYKNTKSQKDEQIAKSNKLSQDILKIENEESKISYKIQILSENLYDSYEIDMESAKEYKDGSIKISNVTIKKLKDDISSLGNVNLDSIEQYKKIEERYLLYKTQKEDLEQSIEKINGIIKSLEKSMIHDFKENFDIINKNFNDIFKILFGGGSGSLTLENENDVLNSNIEISVQPPGKKLRGLSMLSGGEKALSAIALLFAIIAKKPVPFCILDEIDAPLDDANIFRYITYLGTLTDTTQFVTITHRRTTMEASDYIYGVTMQEKGISNILSLQLEDAKHYIE